MPRIFLVHLFCVLSFYSYGTALMDYFAFYPSWSKIGAAEFPAYHVYIGQRIILISVLPFVTITVMNILLFWFRPALVPRSLVAASFLCFVVGWLSSIFLQIPMQLQLEARQDMALLQRLMDTNWIRFAVETTQVLFAFRMLLSLTTVKASD